MTGVVPDRPVAVLDAAIVEQLRSGLPEDAVLTDEASTEAYRYDMAKFCAAGRPAVVVPPPSPEERQRVLRVAPRPGAPVVPRGARSGLSGGANALDGCIVLSLTRM